MKILLDTHTILWSIEGDSQLSTKARMIIEDIQNEVYLSAISLFEISIKLKLGKLSLQKPLNEILEDIDSALLKVLPISHLHLLEYQNLPLTANHRDPFDLLIIATAISENADIISRDKKFDHYRSVVNVIW
jgi:PIN domain nuclease of toxin-antitoxin system